MRSFLPALFMFAASVPALQPAQAESFALVVGVNDCPQFRLPDGSRPRALRGAESDAQEVADALTGQFGFAAERVQRLLGKDATRTAFRAACEKLTRTLQPADSLVLYFAGHGTQVKDQKPLDEEDGLDEALCLADASASVVDLVLDDELGAWLDDLPAGRVTVIFDCCHAGTGIKDADDDLASRYLPVVESRAVAAPRQSAWQDLQSMAKSLTPRPIVALFACQSDQQAYERRFPDQKAPARSGQFTRYLLDGLKDAQADANRDRRVTTAEIGNFIRRKLDEQFNATRTSARDRQEPVIEAPKDPVPLF